MFDLVLESKWKTSKHGTWVLYTRMLCMGSSCRIAPGENTHTHIYICILFASRKPPSGPGPYHQRGFTITLRHTELGRTPLDEWSACHRDLYLTTHNSHYRHSCPLSLQTFMPPVTTDFHAPCGYRTRNPSKRVAVALHLRQWGHWDRLYNILHPEIENVYSHLRISSSWFWHRRMNCFNGFSSFGASPV